MLQEWETLDERTDDETLKQDWGTGVFEINRPVQEPLQQFRVLMTAVNASTHVCGRVVCFG